MSLISVTIEKALKIAFILALFVILPLFQWPDISPALSYIQTIVNYLYFFNPVFPIDTMLLVLIGTLSIELAFYLYKLFTIVVSFFFGFKFGHHKDKE